MILGNTLYISGQIPVNPANGEVPKDIVAQARQSQITDPSAQSPTSQSPTSINITEGLPPPCDQIVLTLEPFISTSGNIYDLLDELAESVAYWRQFIPYDGIKLSEALKVSTRRTDYCQITKRNLLVSLGIL